MVSEVEVYFVYPKGIDCEDECDQEMQQAFNHCSLHSGSGINAQWISEEDCAKRKEFSKKDVLVLQEFKGSLFHKLLKTKALVVGARCLSCCLTEGTPIPPGPHPVYTIAMNGLTVTASGFTKEVKDNIRNKVFWMGGKYESALSVGSTHLVSNTIFSDKYVSAQASNVPVMKVEWVEAVWKASLERNISAQEDSFMQQYRLPPFYGAVITTTGFSKRDKEKITKLIEKNGGGYKGTFESTTTDVVVISDAGIGSEKHKAGVEHKKLCVSAAWVYDSISAGYALPAASYNVYESKTSSPIQSGRAPDMSINVSTIASVRNPMLNLIDDTCSTTVSSDSTKMTKKQQDTLLSSAQKTKGGRLCPIAKELGQLVDGLDMKEVRQAGTILEDCGVYVYGVTVSRRDKLHRVVDRCGGMRFSTPHDQVTHALCGDPSKGAQDRESMPKAMHLTTKWLVDCVRAKELLDETQYLVIDGVTTDKCESVKKDKQSQSRKPQLQDSPMSKKNLQLLKTSGNDESVVVSRPPVPLFRLDAMDQDEEKDDIVQQYRECSQMAVGESEDALAQYFKKGGVPLSQNDTNKDLPVENADSNVTLRRDKSIRPNATVTESVTRIRVKDGDDKTVVDGAGVTDATTMTEMSEDLSDLFNGLTFEFQGIEESSTVDLIVNIQESGGRVVEMGAGEESLDPERCYVVVPMDYDEEDVVNKQAKVINTFWLDDCLTQRRIVEVTYYHRPIKVAPCLHPLEGLTIGISNYLAVERSFIDELAQLLGATTQNTFCRRNASGNKASTHLICPTAEGNKYAGALKWGLPAVTSQWLLECARRGRRVREGPYLIGGTKEPEWSYEESTESKIENQTSTIQQNDYQESAQNVQQDDTSKIVENKENISCDRGEVAGGLDTVELDHEMAEDVGQKDGTMVEERAEPDGQMEPPPPRKSIASDSFSNIKFNTPKTRAKLSLGPSTEMSPVSRILARARMPDSQESPKRVLELCNEARLANESVRTPPMDNALSTPNLAVFSPTSRRRLQALKRGEMPSDPIRTPRNPFEMSNIPTPESPFGAVLRPDTGHMSADSKKRLQKLIDQLPEGQNNQHKLTPISDMSRKFFSRFDPAVAKQLNISDADDTPPAKQRKLDTTAQTSENSIENQLKQLNNIISAVNTTSSTPKGGRKSLAPLDAHMEMRACNDEQKRQMQGPDSQTYTVGWDDVSQPSSSTKTTMEVEQKIYKFIISMNVQNRDEIISKISELGGIVSDSGECDSSISHLVHGKPSRSEKVLAAIAAGIWLVHPSYIDRSCEQGKFVSEEEYEWGNPLASTLPKLESSADLSVAMAAYRWRLARTRGQDLPFCGMRMFLHVPQARKPPLVRVVVSGDGTILDAGVPFTGEHDATLCIAENSVLPFTPEDLDYLVDRRIPVCPPTYISKILLEDPPPEAINYAYPFYLRRLREKTGD